MALLAAAALVRAEDLRPLSTKTNGPVDLLPHIRTSLFGARYDAWPELGMVVLPRGKGEYAVLFRQKDSRVIEVEYAQAKEHLWHYHNSGPYQGTFGRRSDVEITRQRRVLPPELVRQIKSLWLFVLVRTHHPEPADGPVTRDADIYQFGMAQSTGETSSPKGGVALAMVNLGDALREYVKDGDEEALRKKVRTLEAALENARPVSP